MTRFFWSAGLLGLALMFSCCLSLCAQNKKRLLTGKITDVIGLPISNVNVSIENGAVVTATDEKGKFLLKVPTGKYVLKASSLGYFPIEREIDLESNQAIHVQIKLLAKENLMNEVIVSGVRVESGTATRTLTKLQDIPQAITVVGQNVIKQQAAFDLTTLTRNITGLNFTGNYSGAGSSQFFNARGFDLNNAQNYRWNGVMIWNWGNNYSDNIAQVEFLKGPASILFGDVAPGGVMNFVTKKPLAAFMANVDFKMGSWGLVRPSIDITGPLTKDHTIRYRLNISYEKMNSFRDQVSSKRSFIAPSVSWDLTPKLTLNIEAVIKGSRSTDDAGLVSPDGTISGLKKLSPSLYLGEPSRKYLFRDQSYFSTLSYELSKTWRLKATGFYGYTTNRPFGIWFDQPDDHGDFVRRQYGFYQKAKNKTISLDAYGAFYTGTIKHNVLIGIEYQSTSSRYTNGGELDSLDKSNIYDPVYGQSLRDEPAQSPFRPYVSLLSRKGIHLQDQLKFFNEKFHVLIALRAGSTRQGNHYFQKELAGTVYEGYRDDITSNFVLTPRVGVVYKPISAYSIYASYTKGYEINSPDIFAKNYLQYATPPATVSTQVELGNKANLFNNTLGLTLSIYEINKKNPYGYVYLNPLRPDYDQYNVYYDGHHRSRGIELEADGRIFSFLSISTGIALTKTQVISDPGYPSGNVLPHAPKLTANGWINYEPKRQLIGFTFGTGLFYKSDFFSSLVNNPDLQIPRNYTWDAALGYKYKQAGIQLNVMNLTNQVSYLNPWQFNLFDVRPLRQFVLTLTYKISQVSRPGSLNKT